MKALAVLLASSALGIASAQTLNWTLTIQLEAHDATLRGVPVSRLDPSLALLSLLRCDGGHAQFTPAQCAEIGGNRQSFRLEADLNGDRKSERVETAVAKLRDGDTAAVLMIRDGAHARPQVFIARGNGFSVVTVADGLLEWSQCMECDGSTSIRWNARHKRFEALPPEDFSVERPSSRQRDPAIDAHRAPAPKART